jgi:hypothetical protein
MKPKKSFLRDISGSLMKLAFLAVLAAAWGFARGDLWLASTQWLLVAAVLGVFGLYARLEA